MPRTLKLFSLSLDLLICLVLGSHLPGALFREKLEDIPELTGSTGSKQQRGCGPGVANPPCCGNRGQQVGV